jgi:ArsR family transcriptional regulator
MVKRHGWNRNSSQAEKTLDSIEYFDNIHICTIEHTSMNRSDKLISDFFTALSHPNRVKIVELLRDGERCQCIFPDSLGIEQSNLSRHIKILTAAKVLNAHRDGVKIMLSVADPRVFDVVDVIKDILRKQLRSQSSVMEQLS